VTTPPQHQTNDEELKGALMKKLGLTLTAILLSVVAIARAQEVSVPKWQQAVSGAEKEGKVVVFGPPGDIIRRFMTQGFRKAFPKISIEYSGGRGGELATRLKAEMEAGVHTADVFLTGTTTAVAFFPKDVMAPIPPALILPEVTDPKRWRDQHLLYSDSTTPDNLIFVNHLSPLIVYNLDQVKVADIDRLDSLLEPKWKGKIVLNDPLPSGAAHVHFRWLWELLGAEKAQRYYRSLRKQAGAVDRDQRQQIEWIAQGKHAALVAPSGGVLAQLLQRGLKVGVLGEFKDVGGWSTASFGSLVLLKKAPHPNAATVFVNWLLTKEAQTAWSQALYHMSRRVDVPTSHLPPYVITQTNGKYWSKDPKPGDKYWLSDLAQNLKRTPEEETILKELFGR
jgi:ABC-type Fe3+ transport system substrate-binding protein